MELEKLCYLFPELSRRIGLDEVQKAVHWARQAGLYRLDQLEA